MAQTVTNDQRAGMIVKTRVVPFLTDFQIFVFYLTREMRLMGHDGASEITPDMVARAGSLRPHIREVRDKLGWQWDWPDREKERVADVVSYNLRFFDQPMYAYPSQLDIMRTEYTDTEVTTSKPDATNEA